MHLFSWNPDYEGELLLRFAWLPYWLGANAQLRMKMQKAVAGVIRPGLKVGEVSESEWASMDEAAIKAIVDEYPYIEGLEDFLRSLLAVQVRIGKDPVP